MAVVVVSMAVGVLMKAFNTYRPGYQPIRMVIAPKASSLGGILSSLVLMRIWVGEWELFMYVHFINWHWDNEKIACYIHSFHEGGHTDPLRPCKMGQGWHLISTKVDQETKEVWGSRGTGILSAISQDGTSERGNRLRVDWSNSLVRDGPLVSGTSLWDHADW